MTDNEIIKALECCFERSNCKNCPLWHKPTGECLDILASEARNLITRQNAEIERLENKQATILEHLSKLIIVCAKLLRSEKQFTDETAKYAFGLIGDTLLAIWNEEGESGDT